MKSASYVLSARYYILHNAALRWGSSFAFVVGVYTCAVFVVLNWYTNSVPAPAQPMAAMMVDLAPMPVAPKTPPHVATSGPEQKEMPPAPADSIPEQEREPLPELPAIKDAEAVLPPEPKPIEEEVELEPVEKQVVQEDKAPPAIEAPADDVAAAPMEGAVSLAASQAPATWQSVLLGHLENHKRYPREARRNREEGVVYVRVKINRDGTLVNYRLDKSCKHEALNKEALAMIARAQPLPPPPTEVEGDTVEFVVPVEFFLR